MLSAPWLAQPRAGDNRLTLGERFLGCPQRRRGARGKEVVVAGNGKDAHAFPDPHPLLGSGRVDAEEDGNAALRTLRADRVDSRLDLRVPAVAEGAGRAGHVVRADRHRIDAGYREVLVEHRDDVDVLDLRHDEDRRIGDGKVLLGIAVVVGGTARTETAAPERRIAAGGDQRLAFLHRVDHRRENAFDAEVEQLLDADVIVPRRADDRNGIGAVQRHQHVVSRLEVPGAAVLAVDDDEIEAGAAEDFRRRAVGDRQPSADGDAAVAKLLLQGQRAAEHPAAAPAGAGAQSFRFGHVDLLQAGVSAPLPANHESMLSATQLPIAESVSSLQLATCGVITTLSSFISAAGTRGSSSNTSRPAAALRRLTSASTSASSSTSQPRATLTKMPRGPSASITSRPTIGLPAPLGAPAAARKSTSLSRASATASA